MLFVGLSALLVLSACGKEEVVLAPPSEPPAQSGGDIVEPRVTTPPPSVSPATNPPEVSAPIVSTPSIFEAVKGTWTFSAQEGKSRLQEKWIFTENKLSVSANTSYDTKAVVLYDESAATYGEDSITTKFPIYDSGDLDITIADQTIKFPCVLSVPASTYPLRVSGDTLRIGTKTLVR